jgi:transposase
MALLDEQLAALVASDERTSQQVELLKSVDGVGDRIALHMVAVTMGFTRFQNPRQFFCYAGLAPFRYTSGKSIRSKSKVSQRTNKQMKSLLHIGFTCIATHMKSRECKEYYERKVKEGKYPTCVLNVIRAKMVSRMLEVIRRNEPYKKTRPLLQPVEKNPQKTIANS